MKKSILLATMFVCASVIAFAQNDQKQVASGTKTSTTATTKATTTASPNNKKTIKTATWTKTSDAEKSANTNGNQQMTAPTKATTGAGVRPATKSVWTGGKAQGPTKGQSGKTEIKKINDADTKVQAK